MNIQLGDTLAILGQFEACPRGTVLRSTNGSLARQAAVTPGDSMPWLITDFDGDVAYRRHNEMANLGWWTVIWVPLPNEVTWETEVLARPYEAGGLVMVDW